MTDILVIDDQETNVKILKIFLEKEGYRVHTALSGQSALQTIESYSDDFFDLILTDINMPSMSGFKLCEIIKTQDKYKEKCQKTPIIFISALTSINDISQGFELGAVDYITKPFNAKEVKLRVKNHLEIRRLQKELADYNKTLENKVEQQVKEIAQTQMATIFSLAKLAQSRDDDTGKHLERVQIFCKLLTVELSKQDKYKDVIDKKFIENIYHASPLHDIGKVGISDLILLKPGRFTDEEFAIMKSHTTIGAKTLEEVDAKYGGNEFIKMGILIAHYHHERQDGKGYPEGLAGDEIPLCAKIMAVADVYDALKTKRVYKEAFDHTKCVEILKEGSGMQFDSDIINAFLNIEDEFRTEWERLQDVNIFH